MKPKRGLKRKTPKNSKNKKNWWNQNKVKNYILLLLVAALILSWASFYFTDFKITGLLVADYAGYTGVEDGSYFKGADNAPVTIIEFSDFQCPFCKKGWQVMDQVEQEYVKSGKVKIIFKHLPLSFHKMAEPAALAAYCTGKQGKFWEYHDKIFTNQDKLRTNYLKTWARELKLDMPKFEKCLAAKEGLAQIQKDKKAALAAGIKGTPAYLINGEKISGAQSFNKFKEVIDRKFKG